MFSPFAFLVWETLQRNTCKPGRLSDQGKQLGFKKERKKKMTVTVDSTVEM